jgi:hypothetical protein
MITTSTNLEDPYAKTISDFFTMEFPQINGDNSESTMEYVTNAIIATNQVRFGPVPNPESLVAIRAVVRDSIESGIPIPMLVPWGSRKTKLGSGVDVAELFALKTLHCLQSRIIERYPQGLNINMRIEDVSGNFLFVDDGPESISDTERYCDTLSKLVYILGYNNFITPLKESMLFSEKEFERLSEVIVPLLMAYLTDTDSYGISGEKRAPQLALEKEGWRGGIPKEQRDYYRGRYMHLYPDITPFQATEKLARYLAGPWIRRLLFGTGTSESWGDSFLRLTFEAPVPGAPASLYSRDIIYRTLPMKFARTNIRPWRAKGFMEINNEGTTPKLASWTDVNDYYPCQIVFSDGNNQAAVQSDYILK